ncbi:MAG: alpha/beta hydrolase [Acidimicrobiales bacterium]
MKTADLSSGTITYVDTGGSGPVVVMLHGLLMDASLWEDVVEGLGKEHRCIVPTLPLGAHATPMSPDADLSLTGIARLVTEFLDQLNLTDVTLVGNDTGGAIVQLLAASANTRIARIVLVSCEAFDNVPPGLTGKTVVLIGRLPPALFRLFMQQMRLKPMRRLPIAFGWLTKRGDKTTKHWMQTLLANPDTCRDAVKVLRALHKDRKILIPVADQVDRYAGHALVVWAEHDRVMPPEHGQRLADKLAPCTLVRVPDTRSLIPLDQPEVFTAALNDFIATSLAADPEG